MCGRFSLTAEIEALTEYFQLTKRIFMKPRYNIAPSELIPVLKTRGELEFLRWGFLPAWQKRDDSNIGFINARSETLLEKPSFRDAFKKRRCLVIADGFYEWKKINRIKQPYYIRQQNHEPFACW